MCRIRVYQTWGNVLLKGWGGSLRLTSLFPHPIKKLADFHVQVAVAAASIRQALLLRVVELEEKENLALGPGVQAPRRVCRGLQKDGQGATWRSCQRRNCAVHTVQTCVGRHNRNCGVPQLYNSSCKRLKDREIGVQNGVEGKISCCCSVIRQGA